MLSPAFELPVFDSSRHVAETKDDFREAAEQGSTFLRRVRIGQYFTTSHPTMSLTEMLAIADKEFETAARYCGAAVVKHTWGFHAVNPTTYWQPLTDKAKEQLGIPEEHELVAEVASISPNFDLRSTSHRSRVNDGVNNYNRRKTNAFRLYDLGEGDFITGTDKTGPRLQRPRRWLTDVDLTLATGQLK